MKYIDKWLFKRGYVKKEALEGAIVLSIDLAMDYGRLQAKYNQLEAETGRPMTIWARPGDRMEPSEK